MNNKKSVEEFLSHKDIAVIGVSSKGKGFGVTVYNHLKKAGYKVVGINKNGGKIGQDVLYKNLYEIPVKVDAVVTVIPPVETEKIVNDLIKLSIKQIWMQQGSESENAIKYCVDNGINVIAGECIMMFAEPVESIHSFHRWLNKLFGKYPN